MLIGLSILGCFPLPPVVFWRRGIFIFIKEGSDRIGPAVIYFLPFMSLEIKSFFFFLKDGTFISLSKKNIYILCHWKLNLFYMSIPVSILDLLPFALGCQCCNLY